MKLGLGQSYDNVSILSEKSRAYLDITKPASTLGVMGTYFIASLFYFYYTGQPEVIVENIPTIIYAVVTIGLAHGASQALNMAEDAEIDAQTEHKKNRPIPAGIITKEEARTIAWFLILGAVARAFLTSPQFGVMVTILVFFGVFYNLDPIRAKERIISIPWQAASRGLLSFPAIWAAYDSIWNVTPWVLGVFMFFYVLGFQNSADIIDRHVDAEYGIRTFIVEYGVKDTVLIAFGCTMAMVSVIAFSVGAGVLPSEMYSMLLIVPLCLYMVEIMWSKPYEVSETTGNHPAWLWFYLGMVLCVAIPTATVIVT